MAATETSSKNQPAPKRWQPILSHDNRFFWEGLEAGKLLIQRCTKCEMLRHPPGPMCPQCQSLEWDALESAGKGEVYSYTVMHHPAIPPFEYPNPVVLIELDEGTRLITQLKGVDSADVNIGMRVELAITEVQDGLNLPLFRPAG